MRSSNTFDLFIQVSQFSRSVVSDSLRPHGLQHTKLLCPSPTHVCKVSDAIQASHPLSSPSPPTSIFPSIRVFSKESLLCIRWPKYWSFSFNISPSNEYSGLPISTVLQKIKTSHLFLSVIKTVVAKGPPKLEKVKLLEHVTRIC